MEQTETGRPAHHRAPHRDEAAFLQGLGDRVRALRARRGLPRRALARDTGISERYLAQLETGQGNISIVLLRQIAQTMNVPLATLVDEPAPQPDEPAAPARDAAAHSWPVALVGLRGAGKSTIGTRAAASLGLPHVELDEEIRRAAGAGAGEILDLCGPAACARYERRALAATLERHDRAVISAGSGLFATPESFRLLRSRCFTVWIKAAPEAHLDRVMGGSPGAADALGDLRRVIAERQATYGRADAAIDTTGRSVASCVNELLSALRP